MLARGSTARVYEGVGARVREVGEVWETCACVMGGACERSGRGVGDMRVCYEKVVGDV